MNREVHYDLTREWARDEGFSADEAETIAAADWGVDAVYDVYVWANKGYHFAWLGANRRAKRLLTQAIENHDLVALGESLHCAQDAIGHGFWGHLVHWEGIDRWERRGPSVRRRLERKTRQMLVAFRSLVPPTAAEEPPLDGPDGPSA